MLAKIDSKALRVGFVYRSHGGGGGVGGWLMVVVVVVVVVVPPDPTGSRRIPPDPAGSRRIPPDPTGSRRIPPDPAGSHRIPQGPGFPANDFPKLFGQFPLPQGPNRGRKLVFWRNCELTD